MVLNEKRESNIDLMRICCMMMIIALHFFSHSDIWGKIPVFSANYFIAKTVVAFSRCAVNGFVLVAGYLNVSKRFSSRRLVSILVQTWTYSVILLVVATVGGLAAPSSVMSTRALFPVSTKMYWFITTYFGLMLLAPFMNRLLNTVPYQVMKRWVGVGFFLFCILQYAYPNADLFYLNRGYSLMWFIFVYAVGALIKRKGQEAHEVSGGSVLLYIIPALAALGGELLYASGGIALSTEYKHMLTDYTSPLTLLSAVGLFSCMRKVNIRNAAASRAATMLGANTLGVYLLHEWPYLRNFLWKELFVPAEYGTSPMMLLYILFCVAVIFFAGILVETIRGRVAKAVLNQGIFASAFAKIDSWFTPDAAA